MNIKLDEVLAKGEEIREQKLTNAKFINNKTCLLCMECYQTMFVSRVLPEEYTVHGRKLVRYGRCIKCGTPIQEQISLKSQHDKAKAMTIINNYDAEIKVLQTRKSEIKMVKGLENAQLMMLQDGKFYNTIKVFDPKKDMSDKEFETYVKMFFKLRRYYKHITQRKFWYSSYDEEEGKAASAEDMNSEYQYCSKLQDEIIYRVCRHRATLRLWFTDRSKLLKMVKKFNKTERAGFALFVLKLGKQIEGFQFLNYGLAFGDLELATPEQWRKYNAMKGYKSVYSTDGIEKWVRTNHRIIEQFKRTRVGADAASEEIPVNDGLRSHQLTEAQIAEYDRIIDAQHKKESEGVDNKILKEMEEEAL